MINVKIDASGRNMGDLCDAVQEALMRITDGGEVKGHGRTNRNNFTFEVTDPE